MATKAEVILNAVNSGASDDELLVLENTPESEFNGDGKNSKKRKKRISTNSTGYEMLDESIDAKDIKKIRQIVRDVVANILRDIWIKRSVWKDKKN